MSDNINDKAVNQRNRVSVHARTSGISAWVISIPLVFEKRARKLNIVEHAASPGPLLPFRASDWLLAVNGPNKQQNDCTHQPNDGEHEIHRPNTELRDGCGMLNSG